MQNKDIVARWQASGPQLDLRGVFADSRHSIKTRLRASSRVPFPPNHGYSAKCRLEAASAQESLRLSGFRVTSHTGAYRLIRLDGSQAQLYHPEGGFAIDSGCLGNVSNDPAALDAALILGLDLAQRILADEARRAALPRPVFGLPGSRPNG
jgi:hypothetical protein